MRRLTAILLTLLMLFNLIGYRLLIHALELQAEIRTEQRIDAMDYDENALIKVTVPLSLPYQVDMKEYEAADGKLEIAGITYHYVKKTINHGKLILLCLPDTEKKEIENTFRNLSGIQDEQPVKSSPLCSVVKKAFVPFTIVPEPIITTTYNPGNISFTVTVTPHLPCYAPGSIEQPPDIV